MEDIRRLKIRQVLLQILKEKHEYALSLSDSNNSLAVKVTYAFLRFDRLFDVHVTLVLTASSVAQHKLQIPHAHNHLIYIRCKMEFHL